MATKVYISAEGHEDLPLLADSQVVWEQKKGVGAFQTILHTQPNLESRVKDMSNGLVTLNIIPDMGDRDAGGQDVAGKAGSANKLKVEKLYILDYPAAQHPKYFAFVLADCRWMWEYYHIVTRYNVRRRIGFKRVEAPNEELAEVKPDIWFKKFSLQDPDKGEKGKWTPQAALADVMGQLMDYEFEHDVYNSNSKRKFHLDRELQDLLDDVPLDDLEIDDNGGAAVQRLMSRLPMVNLYLKHNGDVQFYNAVAGGDEAMVSNLGPEVFGTGHIDWVSKANVRPSKVHILFTKEIEVRFDSQDEPVKTCGTSGSTVTGALPPSHKAKAHLLENVLPIPDYKLKVDLNNEPQIPAADGATTATLPQGSWISFHTALNAWNNVDNLDQTGINNLESKGIWPFLPKKQKMGNKQRPTGPDGAMENVLDPNEPDGIAKEPVLDLDADGNPQGTKLDFPFIRKGMVPWVDMWSGIVAGAERFPSALHSARLLAIPMHWRLTYRIPNDWVDGCLNIRAYRVGIVDQETGTRSPSMVFANYTIANTMRNMFKGGDVLNGNQMKKSHGNSPSVFWTLWGYPGHLKEYKLRQEADKFFIHPDFSYEMNVIDSLTKAGPASLMILDEDQGIIRVDWKTDPLKLMDVVIPGHIAGQPSRMSQMGDADWLENENIRDRILKEEFWDIGQDIKTWAARDGIPRGWNWVEAEGVRVTRMTHENRMATILTMVPAAPNDIRQLHKVTVKPEDIKDLLPDAAKKGLFDAKGPEMYVRVSPQITTARYAWKDTAHHAQIARNNFGIDQPLKKKASAENQDDNKPDREEIEYEFKDDSLINQSNSGRDEFVISGGGGASALRGPAIDEISLAYAAKIYASFTDKLSGTVDGLLNSNVNVAGYIGSVSHMVNPHGAAYTSLSLAEPVPPLDIYSILDDGTRNLVMRLPT